MAKSETVRKLSGLGRTRRYRAVVVCDGNSLTDGFGAQYPSQLQALYPTSVLVINLGVSGQTTPDMISNFSDVAPFLGNATPTVVVAWEIRNDIRAVSGRTPAAAVQYLWDYCTLVSAGNAKPIVLNVTQCTTPDGNLSAQDITDANSIIASDFSAYARRLVDVGSEPNLQNPADATYFQDGIHMTAAGFAIVANAIFAEIPSVSAMRLL